MEVNAHASQQTAASTGAATAAQKSGGRAAGIFGTDGAQNFMDLIFAHLTEVTGGEAGKSGNEHPLLKKLSEQVAQTSEGGEQIISDPDYTGHEEPLSTQQILQSVLESDLETDIVISDETEAEIGTPDVGELTPENLANETGPESPALFRSRHKLNDLLQSLIEGLPQENKPEILDLSPGQITRTFGRLEVEVGEGESSALIATGLTPEDLTQMIQDIANGDEQGEALIIGVAKIMPPNAKKETIFLPRGVVVAAPQHPAGEMSGTVDDTTIMKLNNLTPGSADGSSFEEGDFDGVLRVLERAQEKLAARGKEAPGLEKAINNIQQKISAGLSTVQGTPPGLSEMFTNFAVESIYPEGLDLANAPGQSTSLNSVAQSASLIGQAQQAGTPHPATQMVASAIAKATTNGETRNVTIHLEPPALGKVRISIEFNNEKNTAKALLVAEKPETHLMLQRDAQLLERALQDAGLDMDGSSLEFELAQDGNMFEQDDHSTGGNSGGGSDESEINADGEEIEIIETTMDWYVDPETGAMRYDALV